MHIQYVIYVIYYFVNIYSFAHSSHMQQENCNKNLDLDLDKEAPWLTSESDLILMLIEDSHYLS